MRGVLATALTLILTGCLLIADELKLIDFGGLSLFSCLMIGIGTSLILGPDRMMKIRANIN